MNTKQAIRLLKELADRNTPLVYHEAIHMAIQALEAKEKHEQELNEKMKGVANEMGIPIEDTKLA